jgi:hypothetical protein
MPEMLLHVAVGLEDQYQRRAWAAMRVGNERGQAIRWHGLTHLVQKGVGSVEQVEQFRQAERAGLVPLARVGRVGRTADAQKVTPLGGHDVLDQGANGIGLWAGPPVERPRG